MEKFLYILLFILLIVLVYTKRNEITKDIMINYVDNDLKFEEPNEYYKNYDYEYVQNTEN